MSGTCKLCRRLVISQAVTFAADTLTINLPAASYNNCQRYCLVVAQTIPAETTIGAPVVVTIGDGTVEYPLLSRFGVQLTAASIRTRTKYATVVNTNATGGAFKLLGNAACAPVNNLEAIDGTDTTTAGGDGA